MNVLSKVPILNKIPGTKTLEYFAHFGVKRILPAMALWGGFQFVDRAWGAITFDKDGRSPLTKIPIKTFEYASLAYSKISDITGLTKISKTQERIAPGSTSLGIFTPAASMVSAYYAGEIAYKYGPKSVRNVIDIGLSKFLNMRYVKKALTPNTFLGTKVGSPFERYAGWALKNPKQAIFSFMMLPVLPFIPGFLGSGKSYRERKAEYSGDKEVPVRKYRGWLLSSSAYEGGKPTLFRRHALNLIKSNWEDRGVVWPSYWRKALHQMSLGILDPYALERYHQESQPVYQSAQYGANIPLVGPIIASTIGRLIKPAITYHETGEQGYSSLNIEGPYAITNKFDKDTLAIARGRSSDQLAMGLGLESEGSIGQLHSRLSKHYRDMIGFRGFLYEATKGAITGKKTSDQFTPYAQDATEMYNPAQSMWGYSLGDVTVFGGELLRRIYPMPSKIWKVNDIPNELFGVSWIPQDQTTGSPKDLTHGTTFDKIQMGWLYGSRKGWEFLYPEVKGLDLEQYPDPIKLEVLQSIAPFSKEFNVTSTQVLQQAISDQLDPKEEQRYYDTMDQVRQLKDQIYAHSSEHAYRVSTEATRGIVTSVREDGGFTLDAFGSKTLRLAGVSLSEQDIRANLLAKQQFESTEALAEKARDIQEQARQLIQNTLYQGASVKVQTPEYDQMNNADSGIEAMVEGLNEKLIDIGVPFSDTGNLAKHNMAQDRTGGIASRAMAKYWDSITSPETFWGQKLIPKQDYLDQYLYKQVFNREVKLWNHPIEHILKPALATLLHRVGVDTVPDFTVERRRNQEYWDIIKYIKYKMLAVKASEDGDSDLASYYHSKWRATMIGSNPTDDDTRDEMTALPGNERAYYTRFASEPDPKKRGKIYKYLPRSAKRIYESTWLKKEAEMSDDLDIQRRWQDMLDSEGFDITPAERRLYEKEKVGDMTIADWIRTRLIQAYAQKNPIPGPQWLGWNESVSIENVELLALKEGGENIEDYGFFDERARMAAYDSGAYTAAIDVHTLNRTNTQALGRILPVIAANDYIEDSQGLPTKSLQPIMNINVRTNGYDKQVAYEKHGILANVDDALGLLVNPFI
ncbi:MAG: hypothetical protein RBR68_13125 [Tenuifilaceae bacterium]|nr:hypothetical protein [Tenuifilaceae bacterium]